MTDWDADTGGGTIRIRDTGNTVEFWFTARDSSDWINGLDFSWTANGHTTDRSINYPTGANWYKVGYVNVSDSQTVTFRLVSSTNIAGIGGPGSISHFISRDTIPSPPSTPTISGVKMTSMVVSFRDGANGGDAIDARQIGLSRTVLEADGSEISSDGATTLTGLLPGTTYYVWARTHNSLGWSAWSGRGSAKTTNVPTAPSAPLLSSITATTVDVTWTDNYNGGFGINAHQVGWSLTSGAPTSTLTASSPVTLRALAPGTTYYISVRAQNANGWSAWSKAAIFRTIAGARVNVGGVWKLAIPFVNVGGVWKQAEAWTRSTGVWKRTI